MDTARQAQSQAEQQAAEAVAQLETVQSENAQMRTQIGQLEEKVGAGIRAVVPGSPDAEQLKQARARFRRDIGKHLADIKERYLIPGETQDTAFMFVPSESVFAEIHEEFDDLVSRLMGEGPKNVRDKFEYDDLPETEAPDDEEGGLDTGS